MKNILVTCPPMLGIIDEFYDYADKLGLKLKAAKVSQSLTVEELVDIVPKYDGWIIGDDPACREVLEAGKKGKLAAAVKWGIGVDNVDFNAFNDLESRAAPSELPRSGDIARSGCGIMPIIRPLVDRMPAISRAEPFGLAGPSTSLAI